MPPFHFPGWHVHADLPCGVKRLSVPSPRLANPRRFLCSPRSSCRSRPGAGSPFELPARFGTQAAHLSLCRLPRCCGFSCSPCTEVVCCRSALPVIPRATAIMNPTLENQKFNQLANQGLSGSSTAHARSSAIQQPATTQFLWYSAQKMPYRKAGQLQPSPTATR